MSLLEEIAPLSRTVTALRQFFDACVAFEQQPNSEQFAPVLRKAEVISVTQKELASCFQVSESTVSRWMKGSVKPHPGVQRYVVSELRAIAQSELRKMTRRQKVA
jgi:DNA-binding transcriptional regulator YiaG